MKKIILLSIVFLLSACKKDTKQSIEDDNAAVQAAETKAETTFKFTPVQHATFVIEWDKEIVYVDPTGGKDAFASQPEPTLILVTDIHGDHFNVETLNAIPQTFDIVAPKAVYDKMPENLKSKTKVISNGETLNFHGFNIEAIPMYNLTEERKNFHVKGRGNGYVISKDDFRAYISGDTEDIPEMRKLENIDVAFVCMNLPYTMTPEAAADATLDFKPKKVIPYHYRGAKDGETYYYDVKEFQNIVNAGNKDIEVSLMEWYPGS